MIIGRDGGRWSDFQRVSYEMGDDTNLATGSKSDARVPMSVGHPKYNSK